jgi:hypothetical protein
MATTWSVLTPAQTALVDFIAAGLSNPASILGTNMVLASQMVAAWQTLIASDPVNQNGIIQPTQAHQVWYSFALAAVRGGATTVAAVETAVNNLLAALLPELEIAAQAAAGTPNEAIASQALSSFVETQQYRFA